MIFGKKLIRIRGHAVWTPLLSSKSIVVDAGAHKGEFSREIYDRFGCRCILIEANPELAAKLIPPPGGKVIHAALAAEDGEVDFVFRDNPEGGGILKKQGDRNNPVSPIEMRTLANIMQSTSLSRIDLLKLDIEGAEFALLEQTSEDLLAGVEQVTVEFHDFLQEFSGKGLFEKVRHRLEKLGFVCFPMAFRTHGDVLFLNRANLKTKAGDVLFLFWLGKWALKFFDMSSRKG